MKRFAQFVVAMLCAGLLFNALAVAGEEENKEKPDARTTAYELRRQWLRNQLPKLIADKVELAAFITRLETLNEFEINELANTCLEVFEARRQQQFAALRAANARERARQDEAERELGDRLMQAEMDRQWVGPAFFPPYPYPAMGFCPPQPPVGFFPVVTWLPAGVVLPAHAIVSPDRRHVHMSLMPFFSTIGPVYTFNHMTGETHPLGEFDRPERRPPVARPYYDGLRTRNDLRRP